MIISKLISIQFQTLFSNYEIIFGIQIIKIILWQNIIKNNY